MKKNIIFFKAGLISGLFLLMISNQANGQNVIFKENMGILAITFPPVNTYNYYENSGNSAITYSGTGEVSPLPLSAGAYPNASGGNHIALAENKTFSISGINISNFVNLTISFGVKKCGFNKGTDLSVIANINGTDVQIPFNLSWYNITWNYYSSSVSFPLGSVLTLNFINNGDESFLIDDILIMGLGIVPTPITLSSFEANKLENGTQLVWKTAMENNNSYFDIEKSIDGKDFTSIGEVPSQNNATGADYEFIDQDIKKTSFYRLKSVDMDGKFEYSWILCVKSASTLKSSIHLVHNVVENQLPIQFNLQEKETIIYSIYDLSGKQISGNIFLPSGDSKINIDISAIPAGIYIFKTNCGKEIKSLKFVKK